MSVRILTGPEVAEHASRDSCWIIVHGKQWVYLDKSPSNYTLSLCLQAR